MSAGGKPELIDWNVAVEKLCDAMNDRAAQLARRASEHLYEDFLYSVQEYLRDNTEFNLSSELVGKDAEIARLRDIRPAMLFALQRADQFIGNGIALGFIRMPDASTPDPAHETPAIIRAAIARAEGRS